MDLELTLEPRTASGKANKRLRRDGMVPGVVFGKGRESLPVQLDAKRLETLYRTAGKTTIVKVRTGSSRARPLSALIRGLQRHPLTGRALHVDFFLVDLTQEMQADIPLTFVGEAPAVEQTGGTLLTSLDHLKVKALPADLPHEIIVDVSSLTDLDAAIHVRDVHTDGAAFTVLNDPDELIAKVVPARVEEEVAPTGLEPEAETAESPAEQEAAATAEIEETG